MSDTEPDHADLAPRHLRQMALARWESDGGAWVHLDQENWAPGANRPAVPPLANAELVQMQVRIIALENLVIAMLAEGSDRQLDLARDMAAYISPRVGFTRHRLTIGAAVEMKSLVERAGRFKAGPHRDEAI